MLVPATVVAALLARELPRLAHFREAASAAPRPATAAADASAQDDWPAFVRLGAVTTVRTFTFFGLLTFVPLYFVDVLHASATVGSMAIAAMLAGGAVGTLVGGRLADVVGRKAVLLGSFALIGPLVLTFLAVGPAAVGCSPGSAS